MRSLRIVVAAGIALVSGCDVAPSSTDPWQCPGCNVVLITVDTLRPDRLGAYGYSRATSPEIDRFFANGTRFEAAQSPSPCTLPAVRQILTGTLHKLPIRRRMAEHFAAAGYRTAAVVSQHHFRRGRRGPPRAEYARGFDHFDVQAGAQIDRNQLSTRNAAEVTDRALSWLEANAGDGRFFLWLHYFDPHDPYDPPAAHRIFGGEAARAQDGDRRSAAAKGHVFSEPEIEALRALYDGEIHFLDAELGRLFRRLEESDLREQTIVVLSADHGEHLGEDGRWDHCQSLHARELDVPLLWHAPGAKTPRSVDRLVSTLDILPTLLKVLGVEPGAGPMDGIPLDSAPEARTLLGVWQDERSLRDREWKLRVSPAAPPRLYRISRDPYEREDVASQEPERLVRMTRRLAETAGVEALSRSSRETIERLRALGYLQEADR